MNYVTSSAHFTLILIALSHHMTQVGLAINFQNEYAVYSAYSRIDRSLHMNLPQILSISYLEIKDFTVS